MTLVVGLRVWWAVVAASQQFGVGVFQLLLE
jgi:hypothetical protein